MWYRLSRYWYQSLQTRLVGSYLAVAILMVGLVALLAYLSAGRALEVSALERLNAVATLKENSLNRWVDEQRRYVVFLAALPQVREQAGVVMDVAVSDVERDAALATLAAYLNLVITNTSDSQELLILDNDGRILFSTVTAHTGRGQTDEPYFTKGLSSTFVQNVYDSSLVGQLTLTISTPLFNTRKQRVGVLASHLNLAQLDRIIRERSGLGESGEAYLVSRDFRLVSQAPLAQGQSTDLHSAGIDRAVQGDDGVDRYPNYQRQASLGVYRWVDERDMALLVEMSEAEAYASARQLAFTIGWAGLGVVSALAVFIYVVARRITRPIRLLTQTAHGVRAGDLTLRAPVLTQDEVGTLAHVFNLMTERLRELIGGLEQRLHELRTAQVALAESEARFRTIFDSVNDAIFVHDLADGRILDVNRKMCEMYGYTREEALTLSVGDISQSVPPYTQADALQWVSKAAQGEPQLFEWLAKDKGGQLFWVEVNMRKANIDRQERLLVSVRDITDRKLTEALIQTQTQQLQQQNEELSARGQALVRAEADLRELNAQLEQRVVERTEQLEAANRELESFSYTVSHDLRAPLRAVAGFSRLVLEEYTTALDNEAVRYLTRVHEGTQRMGRLIDDLLEFARLGRRALKPRALSGGELAQMIGRVTEELQMDNSWPGELVVEELSACRADPALLRQVFANLLSNAFKFSQAVSAPHVTIGCADTLEGETAYFVRDNGMGFDMRYASKLFGVFQRLHTDGDIESTGVGLAIVQRIIQKHGGRVWAQAAVGEGATFYFTVGTDL